MFKTYVEDTPAPERATKRAFQTRFPKTTNGISTKWDVMTRFLESDSYAESIGVTGAAMHALRMLVATGVNRLNASPFVDMSDGGEASQMTFLLTQPAIPAEFSITLAERETIMKTPLADGERYTG